MIETTKNLFLIFHKYFFITLFLLITVLVHSQTLKIGFNESTAKPYKWKENGIYKGAWIDITRIVAERAGVKVELIPLPLKRLFSYIDNGSLDGAFGIYRESKRDEYYIFLDTPIGWSTTYAFTKKEKYFDFNTPQDLYGKQIGKLRGLSLGEELNAEIKKKTLAIQDVSSYEQNILKLLSDRIDVTFAPGLCFQTLINDANLSDKIIKLPKPVSPHRSLHILFSRNTYFPDKNEIISRMDKILQKMAENGELGDITKQYSYDYKSDDS